MEGLEVDAGGVRADLLPQSGADLEGEGLPGPAEVAVDLEAGGRGVDLGNFLEEELVTRADVEVTLDANPTMSTSSAVKLECRSGMGVCQGRYCETTVARLVAARTRRSMTQVGGYVAQYPVKPALLGDHRGEGPGNGPS